MNVLFLNLPYKFDISRASRWPEKTKSDTLYYPYWLAYAAGMSQKMGLKVNLVDCITRHYNTEQTLAEVKKFAPDYIMAEITTPTCYEDYKVIRAIKKTNPNVKIIIGGTHATALPQQVMEECPEIDILVRGNMILQSPRLRRERRWQRLRAFRTGMIMK